MSYPYTAAAARVFGNVYVARFQRSGSTVGFFAFQFRSRLHRLVGIGERVAGELSDYFGLVAEPGVNVTGEQILRGCGLNALYFTHLDEAQQSFGLHGEKPETGLKIAFPEGGPAFWGERRRIDKKFTADTERRQRKLIESHGPLKFVFRHEQPLEPLEMLIAAKRAQYERTGASDSLQSAMTRRFLHVLADIRDPDCRATLSTLFAGDHWVGSHFGLMYGETLHYWFPVYNPDMRAFAPGRLLIKAIIDTGAENGVALIDRGSGDSAAKQDFATLRHSFLRGVWNRPGIVGLAYRARLSARWRLKSVNARLPVQNAEKPT